MGAILPSLRNTAATGFLLTMVAMSHGGSSGADVGSALLFGELSTHDPS